MPLVLKGLDVEILPKQKVGILGRTGSGKSTLILTLTRLLGIESGVIELDGIDTKSVGLHFVRKAMAVIPQDPFLLQGSLKFNIDPFKEFSDDQILDSLNKV